MVRLNRMVGMTPNERREIVEAIERLGDALNVARLTAEAVAEVAQRNGACEYDPGVARYAQQIASIVEDHSQNRVLGIRQLRDAWSNACKLAIARAQQTPTDE